MSIAWSGKREVAKVLLAVIVASVIAIAAPLSGCRYRVNSNNPKVILANDLNSAARATDLVADGVLGGQKLIESLKTQEPEYYAKASKLLVELARLNDQAIGAIQNARAGGVADWRGALLAVAKHASTADLTAFGFKNPNTKAIVKLGLAGLTGVLESIPASFQKGK